MDGNGDFHPFFVDVIKPGQIIATSAEVTLNGGLVWESPKNPLNSGLGIIVICPDVMIWVRHPSETPSHPTETPLLIHGWLSGSRFEFLGKTQFFQLFAPFCFENQRTTEVGELNQKWELSNRAGSTINRAGSTITGQGPPCKHQPFSMDKIPTLKIAR